MLIEKKWDRVPLIHKLQNRQLALRLGIIHCGGIEAGHCIIYVQRSQELQSCFFTIVMFDISLKLV